MTDKRIDELFARLDRICVELDFVMKVQRVLAGALGVREQVDAILNEVLHLRDITEHAGRD